VLSEVAYGVTSRKVDEADPERVLNVNRGIGRSRIAVITSSIGTTMKTGVESVPATAGKYHTDAPIRYRGHQIQEGPQCRTKNARADTQCPPGFRLLADDGKFMPRSRLKKENKFTVAIATFQK